MLTPPRLKLKVLDVAVNQGVGLPFVVSTRSSFSASLRTYPGRFRNSRVLKNFISR
jgi:hypothetical protein